MNKSLEKKVSEDCSVEKDLDVILFESMLVIYSKTMDPKMHPAYFPCGNIGKISEYNVRCYE